MRSVPFAEPVIALVAARWFGHGRSRKPLAEIQGVDTRAVPSRGFDAARNTWCLRTIQRARTNRPDQPQCQGGFLGRGSTHIAHNRLLELSAWQTTTYTLC